MRVRVRAWIERVGLCSYRMRKTDGSYTDPTCDLESLKRTVDWYNNEDSDGHYIEVPDPCEPNEIEPEPDMSVIEARQERIRERHAKEKAKVEANRKDRKASETYVYVISCIRRKGSYTMYLTGETNLMTMKRFAVDNVKNAKVFNTKASAQKVVDTLSKNCIINALYRNMKVVQKKKEIFA